MYIDTVINKASAPATPKPVASVFAEWVYESTNIKKNKEAGASQAKRHRLKLGKIAHNEIDLFFRFKWTQEKLQPGDLSEWDVIFTDRASTANNIYKATALRINGEPMRCRPDVVLRHKALDKVLIIERKTTNVPEPMIPANGWPNVQVQLWCYSWIDDWVDIKDIVLVGQLWQRVGTGMTMCHSHPMWNRNDANFHQRCLRWFERYGGVFSDG